MNTQVFCSRTAPEPRKFQPIRNLSSGWSKPEGGLWTSSLQENGYSDWMKWCVEESYDGPSFNVFHLFPSIDVKIYPVNSLRDLRDLYSQFPFETNSPSGSRSRLFVDWEKASQEYDGVRLTEKGQRETRLTHPLSLYGWDCESTLWFRWKFDKVRPVGCVAYKCEEILR